MLVIQNICSRVVTPTSVVHPFQLPSTLISSTVDVHYK